MENRYEMNTKVFKAFCDPNRLQIIEMLSGGEECACNLLESLDISQPTLSHHMKILLESGIIRSRKDKKWTYYALDEAACENARRILTEVTTIVPRNDDKAGCACG